MPHGGRADGHPDRLATVKAKPVKGDSGFQRALQGPFIPVSFLCLPVRRGPEHIQDQGQSREVLANLLQLRTQLTLCDGV